MLSKAIDARGEAFEVRSNSFEVARNVNDVTSIWKLADRICFDARINSFVLTLAALALRVNVKLVRVNA